MKVKIENPVMYAGVFYNPDENGEAELPDEVAEALGLKKVEKTTITPVSEEEIEAAKRKKA